MSSGFASAEDEWRVRVRMLPNTVRQELVARQLSGHLPAEPLRVLDVGCGQGTQVLRLAERGHRVIGMDHSDAMLADAKRLVASQPRQVRDRVRLMQGEAAELTAQFTSAAFDVVLCHGVLMYMADPAPMLEAIAYVLEPGGIASLLVRNADALALHRGLRGDWAGARAAFGTTCYRNRIGVDARADRLDDLTVQLGHASLAVHRWYGVLTFAEFAAMESTVPGEDELAEIIACEEQAGRTDPYRRIAALLHLITYRSQSADEGSRGQTSQDLSAR